MNPLLFNIDSLHFNLSLISYPVNLFIIFDVWVISIVLTPVFSIIIVVVVKMDFKLRSRRFLLNMVYERFIMAPNSCRLLYSCCFNYLLKNKNKTMVR